MTSFPLGPEQRSVLYLDELLGPGIQHNLTACLPIGPELSDQRINTALAALAEKHTGLSAVITDHARTRQTISGHRPSIRPAGATGACGLDDQLTELQNLRLDRRAEARACAMVRRSSAGPGHLLLAFDHMVCDAQARTVLLQDLARLLTSVPGDPEPAASLERHCSARERTIRETGWLERESAYWTRALAGTEPLTCLSQRTEDRTRWRAVGWEGEWRGPGPHRSLRALAHDAGVSDFVVVAAALAIALWCRSGRPRGALITPVSTRRDPGVARLVSNLVNERPVPYHVSPAMTVRTLLTDLGGGFLRTLLYSRLAIPDLVASVPPYRALLSSAGCEYVQLQVETADEPVAAQGPHPGSGGTRTELGSYRPSTDVTCTTIRVLVAPDTMRVRTFYGGPAQAGGWAVAVSQEIAALLTAARGQGETTVGRLARILG